MNTIDFLFELQKKHTFYKNGLDDLETFIDVFDNVSTSLIEETFTKKLNLHIDEFLQQLQEDLEHASEEEMIKLANIMETYIYAKRNRLVDTIKIGIYHYAVRHPKFDTQKFFKAFIVGLVCDIKKDLYSDIGITFNENAQDKYTLAVTQSGYVNEKEKHHLIIYPNNFKKQWENRIFEILRTVYHEEFHMLVDEMQINPDCFKLEILDYQKTESFRRITKNKYFYQNNYDFIHEETQAEIFGSIKAYEKIKELNPYFSFAKISIAKYESLLWTTKEQFATIYKIDFFEKVNQKKFIDEQLDQLLPKNSDFVFGMMKRIYDEEGYRKSFKILAEDFKTIISENKNVPIEEIENFYTAILYDAYLKCHEQEKEEIYKDENLLSLLIQCIQRKGLQLEKEMKEIKHKKVVSLRGLLKRKYKTKILLEELAQVKKEIKILNREDTNSYGL